MRRMSCAWSELPSSDRGPGDGSSAETIVSNSRSHACRSIVLVWKSDRFRSDDDQRGDVETGRDEHQRADGDDES